MKVYVITEGEYSNYHICAVTLDKDEAKTLQEKFSSGDYDYANIETYDTDDTAKMFKYSKMYACYYYNDDNSTHIDERDFSYIEKSDFKVNKTKYGYYTYVNADNEEMALKIASDKFAKYRAEKMKL